MGGGALVYIVLGGIIAARLPRNPFGWLMLLNGFAQGGVQALGQSYYFYATQVSSSPLPWANVVFISSPIGWITWVASLALMLLLLPNGRLPSRRWRWLVGVVVLVWAVGAALGWRGEASAGWVGVANPYAATGLEGRIFEMIATGAVLVLFIVVLVGGVSLVVQGIRSKGEARQQYKWLVFVGAAYIILMLTDFAFEFSMGWLESLKESLIALLIPLGVSVSILRYRLWEIDVLIRKTAQYTVVSGLLLVIFLGLVFILQRLFSNLFNQNSTPALVLSTLAIAALFAPLRRAVQNVIDRRFYRRKVDAEKVLADFAATVRDETDLDRLTAELVRVIQEAMQPEHVSVWLREPDDRRWARAGEPTIALDGESRPV